MACTWPVDRTCLPEVDSPEDVLRMQGAIDSAVSVLWSLTGRRFSICEAVTRPCPNPVDSGASGFDIPGIGFTPVLFDGRWINEWCGNGCGYGYDNPKAVTLPHAASILGVDVEGQEIAADSYHLQDGVLWRSSGDWPTQDLSKPLGAPGTWSVRYMRGVEPPAGSAMVVGLLAKEFWNVCTGGKCRLPKRTQSVQRQGVTVTMVDPTDILMKGGTGIPEIDLWIHAQNPNHLSQPSAVISPDYLGGA